MHTNEQQTIEQEIPWASDEQKAAAKEAVQSYLNIAQTHSNGIIWNVHVFCRVGDGDDHGFDETQLEMGKHFIDRLISFFLSEDHAQRYNNSVAWNKDELANYLPRLRELFAGLMEDVCRAELAVLQADSVIEEKEAKGITERYRTATEVIKAQRAIWPLMERLRSQRA